MANQEKKIIYFLGPSKSGKTTSIEKVIGALIKSNIKCGTIKFIHHPTLTLDPAGKDSSRHRNAGALFTLNFAPKETAIIIGKDNRSTISDVPKITSIDKSILPHVDILLCESLNHPPSGSYVFISANSLEEVVKYFKELDKSTVLGIIGNITNNKENISEYNNIPLLSALNASDLSQIVHLCKKIINKDNK